MTTTGWSAQVFDEQPMIVVIGLLRYWGDHPPVHVIEAAKAGLGKRKGPPSMKDYQEKLTPPREMTPEEKLIESRLPQWVQDIRAKQREERKAKWLAMTKSR